MGAFIHLPQDQVSQARPLQEQSCIGRGHTPTASRINLHTNRDINTHTPNIQSLELSLSQNS